MFALYFRVSSISGKVICSRRDTQHCPSNFCFEGNLRMVVSNYVDLLLRVCYFVCHQAFDHLGLKVKLTEKIVK